MYQFKKMIKVLLLCLLTACNGNDKEYSVISRNKRLKLEAHLTIQNY